MEKKFDEAAITAFTPAEKIGLIATINAQGLPHITLLTSIMAKDEHTLMLGQFCEGLSKLYLSQQRQAGFLVMTLDRRLWRGKALWRGSVREGEDYHLYNEIPMFRYNTYFGINTVHYLDLVETTLAESLPIAKIALALIGGIATKPFVTRAFTGSPCGSSTKEAVFNPFTHALLRSPSSLKFLAFIDEDGFPSITPVLQALVLGCRRLFVSPLAYGGELAKIPQGATVALFCLNLAMESVLLRGVWSGFRRYFIGKGSVLDVDWVYNSMPPCHGQIYPPVPLVPIREF